MPLATGNSSEWAANGNFLNPSAVCACRCYTLRTQSNTALTALSKGVCAFINTIHLANLRKRSIACYLHANNVTIVTYCTCCHLDLTADIRPRHGRCYGGGSPGAANISPRPQGPSHAAVSKPPDLCYGGWLGTLPGIGKQLALGVTYRTSLITNWKVAFL